MDQNGLAGLKSHSALVGSNPDLVQASGGNTSYKNGSCMWVKGSGFRLKDAHIQNIFAEIKLGSLTAKQIADKHDFSDYLCNEILPSIETNFHLMLEGNFVTHLHSLGAISLGISSELTQSRLNNSEIRIVPYARPGVDLANAIYKIEGFQDHTLLLRNHGVIFTARTLEEIEKKINTFENNVELIFGELEKSEEFPSWVEILVSGVLTPDQAVFLGPKPFIESNSPSEKSVSINSFGELLFPSYFSKDRIEMAYFYSRVAKLVEKKTRICYLSSQEVESLLNWDREKKRIQMAN
ncbi:Class II aldolase/adducin N-terminal [Candidatus Nanopelagicaceae bacterium]